ncbi:hypothetical protein EGW08_021226 [Elysia chlorotica]|uniref:Uncharacterized protein n=1 Tax=Elysia chlorotica TaxID=188477 RepID=A0A3S0Z7B9_ELYCH|nr:hypothetical protein EGW08_021226 [Elysia chlorotica]
MTMASDKTDPAYVKSEVMPVLPEDVQSGKAGPAPPSYEEVMGQYETSVQAEQSEQTCLAYIDIMPRLVKAGNMAAKVMPEFQPFTEIVRAANAWLAGNPGLTVWKCETVERKVLEDQGQGGPRVDLDTMNARESAWGCNCYVFGLRLWLTQQQKLVPVQIGLVNVTPRSKEVQYSSYHRAGFIGLRHYMSNRRIHTLRTYEGLRQTLAEFNTLVQGKPLPGTILNVETATLKFAEGLARTSVQEVAEMSSWHELSGMTGRRRTQVLRVFYVRGPPSSPRLDMAEFLPTRTGQGGLGRPVTFAALTDAERQVDEWLSGQRGIRLLNVETREAKFSSFFNIGGQIDIDTDSTDDFDIPAYESSRLRFLRVFYTSAVSETTSYDNVALISRIFPPARCKGENRYETMMQTMVRIDAWLRVTGLPMFSVETVQFLDEGPSSFKKSHYKLRGFVGKFWVTAIKVYFALPPAVTVPEYLPAGGNRGSSSCGIL